MERLRSQLALAAFLQEVGEAVEQAELVCTFYSWCRSWVALFPGHPGNEAIQFLHQLLMQQCTLTMYTLKLILFCDSFILICAAKAMVALC